jgi:hypothetical protein
MNKRLFFLRQDGWFEAEVTAKLLNSSDGELLLWAYAMMDKHGYRNYWITENPRPSLRDRTTQSNLQETLRNSKIGVPCSILNFHNTEQGTPNDE